MKNISCAYEQEVAACLHKGEFTPEIKHHLEGCPLCRDTLLVARWMGDFERQSRQEATVNRVLPAPEILLEKAHSRGTDRAVVKKALWPLLIPQVLSYLVILVGVLLVMFGDLKIITDINRDIETLYILKFFTSYLPRVFAPFQFIILPLAFIVLAGFIYYLFAKLKPRLKWGSSQVFV